jgi:hypothetical protein
VPKTRGKYAKVLEKLPILLGTDPKRLEKVLAVKKAMLEENRGLLKASTAAQEYVNIRIEKEAFEEILEEIQLRFEAIKLILGDAYENEDVTSLGLADGRTVRIQYEPHAKVFDWNANREWAVKNGLTGLLMLPWPTVNSLTKDMLVGGLDVPDGVEPFAKPKVVKVE